MVLAERLRGSAAIMPFSMWSGRGKIQFLTDPSRIWVDDAKQIPSRVSEYNYESRLAASQDVVKNKPCLII